MYIKEINIKHQVYNLIKVYKLQFDQSKKKLETKNYLTDERNYKNLVINFTRYVH